jgi:hypothetical protein
VAAYPVHCTEALALDLARIDQVLEAHLPLARSGHQKATTQVLKCLSLRAAVLGLIRPMSSAVELQAQAPNRETTTDKIERALNALIEDGKRSKRNDVVEAEIVFRREAGQCGAYMKKRREPTEAEIDVVVGELLAHMREQLEKHGMNTTPAAVRLAAKRRLRSRLALQALTDADRGAA